ncbi:Uncharacterized protein RSN1 [Monoraphidium neglectum]|uniref:Uncharacterized protein RSN1 n=1 Tax=Monoraphidium neglectum TaxID=145388 RepID=A0A0D2MRP1_9CHLO|nr:Uncharacterized protein RSN1 [Monoraphidium neglectum]KIZ05265.1 Uncharacterized protein RSN1 [Monoraphidium neglectum]|eukprot:XP_013904284.1 Uncharacterized protein RSN1 [Monoraphidium neglectum]
MSLRRYVTLAVICVLALFYVIPVAALQGLLQLDRLRQIPFLDKILDIPLVRSLLLGVLPGLALRLFVMLLPLLLYPLNRSAGAVSEADVDFDVSTQYFVFQVLAVFGASFISGTLFNQVQTWLKDPSQVLTLLGTGVPQTASFFIIYTLFVGLIGRSLGLLRLFGLLIYAIRSAFAGTPRARARAWQLQTCAFGGRIPDQTIIMLLGIVFSCIQPLILVSMLIFFAMSLLVEKYNFVYVFRRRFESGGRMWRQVFVQIMTALYIFQAVMVSLLSIKRFVFAPLLVPLFLVTVVYHRAAMTLFRRPWETLSLRDARDLDEGDESGAQLAEPLLQHQASGQPDTFGAGVGGGAAPAPGAISVAAIAASQYVAPPFMPRERELRDLEAEVTRVQQALRDHNEAVEAGETPPMSSDV